MLKGASWQGCSKHCCCCDAAADGAANAKCGRLDVVDGGTRAPASWGVGV